MDDQLTGDQQTGLPTEPAQPTPPITDRPVSIAPPTELPATIQSPTLQIPHQEPATGTETPQPEPPIQPLVESIPVRIPSSPPPEPILKPYDPARDGQSLHTLRYSKSMPTITLPATLPGNIAPNQKIDDTPFNPPRRPERPTSIALKAVGVFLLTFVVVFGGLESPALYARWSYTLSHLGQKTTPVQIVSLPKIQDRPLSLTELKDNPDEFLDPAFTGDGLSLKDLGDNELLIPKIDVRTPIIWGSEPDEPTMLANLQLGVVHYGFTALPNAGTGKVFLTGHSSYYLLDPGKYKTIFANIDRLEPGDQLALAYEGLVYVYEVSDKKVVKPSDLSVLDQTEEPTLSLMTCTPVGTSLNRLIVTAKLVSAKELTPLQLPPPANTDPASIFYYLPF